MEFISEIKDWFNIKKSVNVIHHVSRIKYKSNVIARDEDKISDKV